jgi:hypothetical protein
MNTHKKWPAVSVSWHILILIAAIELASSAPLIAKEPASPESEDVQCHKPIKISGPANQIRSMAELRTIVFWSERVKQKFNPKYAHWHNAKEKRMKCKRSSGSSYFYCELSAKPCKATRIENANDLKAANIDKSSLKNQEKRTGKKNQRRIKEKILTP